MHSDKHWSTADHTAPIRVVEITNEADEKEGFGVINGGHLEAQVFSTRSQAHERRKALESHKETDPFLADDLYYDDWSL